MSVNRMTQRFLVTFVIFSAFSILTTYGFNANAMVKIDMVDTLLKASTAVQSNPVQSAQCFAIYQPQLKAITNAYEHQYGSCLKAAQNEKDIMNNEVQSNYTAVQQISTQMCGSFSKCTQDHLDSYGFFECNNKAASTNRTLTHNIQKISKDRMQYIAMRTAMITFDLNSCTDKCSQEYIEKYSRVYGELKYCLNGDDAIGTTSSTTTSAGTAAPSSTEFPTPPTIIDD